MPDTILYDNLLELAKKRRTNRRFKSDPIPDGYIEKIIDVARWAPSGFHTQPWEFIAVTEKDVRDKVVEILDRLGSPLKNPNADDIAHSASFRDAPVFIFTLCDWRTYIGLPGNMEKDNPRVASVFCSSMASAFLLMHLAATSLGLSSQWYSAAGRQHVEEEIRALIGIPDDLKIYELMILGYPAEPPVLKEVRALKDMLHYNICGPDDFRSDEQVKADAAKTKAWCISVH